MTLPIVAYGSPILRKVAETISADYPDLENLISNMWETMYSSNGVGLAAPQVNRSIRVFVVDSLQVVQNFDAQDKQNYPDDQGIKQVFINPEILETAGDDWPYNEGCLSIPRVREDVLRAKTVTLQYQDADFNEHTTTFNGVTARIIMHEYDHLEGKLFIDYLSPLKRKLLKGKLLDISKGKIRMDYRMTYPR